MKDIIKLQKCLGYEFKNQNLIIEALTHKSYKKSYNNERLEFLGDAVLDLIVGEYLYTNFPKVDEGVLSKMRASLVNEKGLAKIANELNLGDYIFLSLAEENNNGRSKPSLLSNAFEAIVGAIYLEDGLTYIKAYVHKLLERIYPDISLDVLFQDYKTSLQELTQSIYGTIPDYKLMSARGPDHKKEFEMMVIIDGRKYAVAKGHSKKDAQQKAAKKALDILKSEG